MSGLFVLEPMEGTVSATHTRPEVSSVKPMGNFDGAPRPKTRAKEAVGSVFNLGPACTRVSCQVAVIFSIHLLLPFTSILTFLLQHHSPKFCDEPVMLWNKLTPASVHFLLDMISCCFQTPLDQN